MSDEAKKDRTSEATMPGHTCDQNAGPIYDLRCDGCIAMLQAQQRGAVAFALAARGTNSPQAHSMFAAPVDGDAADPEGDAMNESKWPCFWCGSMQAHETGYPGGMSTVPACAKHAAEYPREKAMQMRKEVMARPTSATAGTHYMCHGRMTPMTEQCPDCPRSSDAPADPDAPFSTLTEKGLSDVYDELQSEPWNDRKLAVLTLIAEVRYLRKRVTDYASVAAELAELKDVVTRLWNEHFASDDGELWDRLKALTEGDSAQKRGDGT